MNFKKKGKKSDVVIEKTITQDLDGDQREAKR